MVNGFTIAAIPRTIVKLATLLPMIFPIIMSALPFLAAAMLTTSSGRLVPNAISIKEITHSVTPKLLAIVEALSIV